VAMPVAARSAILVRPAYLPAVDPPPVTVLRAWNEPDAGPAGAGPAPVLLALPPLAGRGQCRGLPRPLRAPRIWYAERGGTAIPLPTASHPGCRLLLDG
jgi:hypothetical protein